MPPGAAPPRNMGGRPGGGRGRPRRPAAAGPRGPRPGGRPGGPGGPGGGSGGTDGGPEGDPDGNDVGVVEVAGGVVGLRLASGVTGLPEVGGAALPGLDAAPPPFLS